MFSKLNDFKAIKKIKNHFMINNLFVSKNRLTKKFKMWYTKINKKKECEKWKMKRTKN